jgi:hypothetical protein
MDCSFHARVLGALEIANATENVGKAGGRLIADLLDKLELCKFALGHHNQTKAQQYLGALVRVQGPFEPQSRVPLPAHPEC